MPPPVAAPVAEPPPSAPAVDPTQAAFQLAFHAELSRAVRDLPLAADARVLDVPCGGGYYLECFRDRPHFEGPLTGADLSEPALALARRRLGGGATLVRADVYRMPFDDASFDLVWCAQSFITLDDPVRALREMARVARPGGVAAVLDADEYHHILLPWPVDLEVPLQVALREGCRRRYGHAGKLSQARALRRYPREAGLVPRRKRTFNADRAAPFGPEVRRFLERHFRFLAGLAGRHLGPEERAAFDRLTDPAGPDALLNHPEAELTCVNTLHLADRPR